LRRFAAFPHPDAVGDARGKEARNARNDAPQRGFAMHFVLDFAPPQALSWPRSKGQFILCIQELVGVVLRNTPLEDEMTKAELIDVVHSKLEGHSKKAVAELVEVVFATTAEAIAGGRFSYPGFGTFTVKTRAAREGRNPSTLATIQIGESKSVGFKPSPNLKSSL
jgi:DNA-binding protein HU-beta